MLTFVHHNVQCAVRLPDVDMQMHECMQFVSRNKDPFLWISKLVIDLFLQSLKVQLKTMTCAKPCVTTYK